MYLLYLFTLYLDICNKKINRKTVRYKAEPSKLSQNFLSEDNLLIYRDLFATLTLTETYKLGNIDIKLKM